MGASSNQYDMYIFSRTRSYFLGWTRCTWTQILLSTSRSSLKITLKYNSKISYRCVYYFIAYFPCFDWFKVTPSEIWLVFTKNVRDHKHKTTSDFGHLLDPNAFPFNFQYPNAIFTNGKEELPPPSQYKPMRFRSGSWCSIHQINVHYFLFRKTNTSCCWKNSSLQIYRGRKEALRIKGLWRIGKSFMIGSWFGSFLYFNFKNS